MTYQPLLTRLTLTLCSIVLVLTPVTAKALSQGPLDPESLANETSIGSVSWSNPGYAGTSNNDSATAVISAGNPSYYLKGISFPFILPSDANIDGIVVEIEKSTAGGSITDNAVRIVKGNTIGSTDRSAGGNWGAEAYTTYGSSSDLWGETWTYTNINSGLFGAAISAANASTSETASVDHMRITVYYNTDVAPVPEFSTWALIILVGAGIVVLKKEGYLEKFAPVQE